MVNLKGCEADKGPIVSLRDMTRDAQAPFRHLN